MKIERFSEMLDAIQREKGISKEALFEAVRVGILSAAKKIFKGEEENLEARILDSGEVKIILKKDDKEQDVTPKDFGRVAALAAKQMINQKGQPPQGWPFLLKWGGECLITSTYSHRPVVSNRENFLRHARGECLVLLLNRGISLGGSSCKTIGYRWVGRGHCGGGARRSGRLVVCDCSRHCAPAGGRVRPVPRIAELPEPGVGGAAPCAARCTALY